MVSLSIVIATFNQRNTLEKTLPALAVQIKNPKDFEVVIADDCSTDGTDQFVKRTRFPIFMKYIRADKNIGRAANRNRGFGRTVGKHVLFLDGDMVPGPGLVAAHMDMWDKNPDEVVVGSIENPPADKADNLAKYLYSRGEQSSKKEKVIPGRYFISRNYSLKREIFEKLGGFDESFEGWGGEDTDFGLRLEAQGYTIRFLPGARCYHYHRATIDQLMARYEEYGKDGYRRLMAKHPGTVIFPRGWLLGLPDSNPGPMKKSLGKLLSILQSGLILKLVTSLGFLGSVSDVYYDWLLYASLARGYRDSIKKAAASGAQSNLNEGNKEQ